MAPVRDSELDPRSGRNEEALLGRVPPLTPGGDLGPMLGRRPKPGRGKGLTVPIWGIKLGLRERH